MAFIDAWLTAYAKLATPTEQRERAPRALADLERSYAAMTASHQAAASILAAGVTGLDLLARFSCCSGRAGRAPKVLRVF